MQPKVIIVSSSYGTDYIKKIGGQSKIIPMVRLAGANGIEIRRELFDAAELTKLAKLGQRIERHNLLACYSVPFHLFLEGGILNPQLNNYLEEAKQLNAKLLKFSLGYYTDSKHFDLLKQYLSNYADIQVVVENDQTECGVIEPFEHFFVQAKQAELPIKMTFDTGNWLCQNIEPEIAAARLADHVAYIHVKASKVITHGQIDAKPPIVGDKWMQLLAQYFPLTAVRGIEFAIFGDDLESVSKKYVELLKN